MIKTITLEDVFYGKLDKEHPNGPKNSCLSWFGGKYEFREPLAALSPPDILIDNYIEVFGGAGHFIFYRHPATNLNVFNDLNKGVYTLFKVIKDDNKYELLRQKLQNTPYSKEVWESCLDWESRDDEVELAWAFLVRHLQAVNVSGGFAKAKEIRGKGKDAYYHAIRKFENKTGPYLEGVREKIHKITVTNYDFMECIDKYDSKSSFFLLDPPYLHQTRSPNARNVYDHEMTNEQHEMLVDKLLSIKGYAMLCGYDNEIYKRLEDNGFTKILLKRVKRSSSNTNRDIIKNEYVWVNYPIFNGILSYFVYEEAIFSFAKFGINMEKGYFTYDDVPECKDIEFKTKNSTILATPTKVKNLEETYNIVFSEAYKRCLLEFNGGYFDKNLLETMIIKPKYLFGILNQEHPLDIETNIKKYPKLLEYGFIPIGITVDDMYICIKSKDILNFSHLPNLITYNALTGDIYNLDNSMEDFLVSLFIQYRNYYED